MIFHDPDTLRFVINVFFAVAAASVLFAVVAVTSAVREMRAAGAVAGGGMVAPATLPTRATYEPTKRAA